MSKFLFLPILIVIMFLQYTATARSKAGKSKPRYDTIIRLRVDKPIKKIQAKAAVKTKIIVPVFVWEKNMEVKEFTVSDFGIDWKSSD